MAMDGDVQVAISDAILRETLRVLQEKFHATAEDLQEAEALILSCSHRVTPTDSLAVIKEDPDYDRILECAVASGAEIIVSGDKDLLRLGEYSGIRIMKVADFLQRVMEH